MFFATSSLVIALAKFRIFPPVSFIPYTPCSACNKISSPFLIARHADNSFIIAKGIARMHTRLVLACNVM